MLSRETERRTRRSYSIIFEDFLINCSLVSRIRITFQKNEYYSFLDNKPKIAEKKAYYISQLI